MKQNEPRFKSQRDMNFLVHANNLEVDFKMHILLIFFIQNCSQSDADNYIEYLKIHQWNPHSCIRIARDESPSVK